MFVIVIYIDQNWRFTKILNLELADFVCWPECLKIFMKILKLAERGGVICKKNAPYIKFYIQKNEL